MAWLFNRKSHQHTQNSKLGAALEVIRYYAEADWNKCFSNAHFAGHLGYSMFAAAGVEPSDLYKDAGKKAKEFLRKHGG